MRFSVIIPVYNKGKYVSRALMSVLAQTYADYELIVVNDGSTDESMSVIQGILKGRKAQLVDQKNSGVSAARNNGVKVSNGEFLCFLDADDWWEPAFLQEMDKLIRSFPEAKLYSTSYFYYKNGQPQVRVDIPTGYFDYCKEYSRIMQMPVWTGATCISSQVFHEFGGFNENLCLGEDFDLWIRIALKYKIAFLNMPLSYYFQDINPQERLIGHLHNPEHHMLWNLDYLAEEETLNLDYKTLIDKLRVYGLKPYYLSPCYHNDAVNLLERVDWRSQPFMDKFYYKLPILIVRTYESVMRIASIVKTYIYRSK